MKTSILLILALFITASLYSQDENTALCDSLILMEVDSVAGVYTVSSRENIVVTNGKQIVEFVFLIVDKTIIVNIALKGSVYCIDETSKVNLKLADGSDFILPNSGKFNCDGEFSLFFGGGSGRKRELGLMQTNPIQYIKVGMRKSVVDKNRANFIEVNIPAEKGKKIMQTLNCLGGY
jgi:hypothetical protein